ncbi:carboxyl transferase domain-containing protein [Streptomyces sp. NBC_01262]|uniref:carboxyl transferase domain-containing protein n=1 Tax=Streptomyces sp. NBC_01262 TaxID=2903803 RepID=UPI002E30346B|nr:carboxyl transferase domain-containing protein [Streptomyces sp. NBC_01262]
MTARERIEGLLDPDSFIELDALVRHPCHDFGLQGWPRERLRAPGRPSGPAGRDDRPSRRTTRPDRAPHRCPGRERSATHGSGHYSKDHHGRSHQQEPNPIHPRRTPPTSTS